MDIPEFDHIEVHVTDIARYCRFLQQLFRGGRYRRISDSGTSMFKAPSGLNIEVKKRSGDGAPGSVGFCLPCVRVQGAKALIEGELGLAIRRTISNPFGEVHFFLDHEGIEWHAKDYAEPDEYVRW